MLSEGGVAPLIAMLLSNETDSREQAAQALHRLAFDCADAQNAIATAGGISPLVGLLDRATDAVSQGAREFAGATLADLARLYENEAGRDPARFTKMLATLVPRAPLLARRRVVRSLVSRLGLDRV